MDLEPGLVRKKEKLDGFREIVMEKESGAYIVRE